MNRTETPFILLDFETDSSGKQPLVFEKPVKIFTTNKLEEVAGIFAEVEQALDEGYYVAGCVSYEASPAFDPDLPVHKKTDFPLVWFAAFEGPKRQEIKSSGGTYSVSEWKYDLSYKQYHSAINKIKEAIETAETYQINFTARLEAEFTGDDYSFYEQLARNQQASYSAYLNIGKYRVLSASPELFFRIEQNKITTKPMKGTIKRGRYEEEDLIFKDRLENSKKDQAENLMIVDLLRNDLGKIAVPGTVTVPKLFEVTPYPTVHQMTSTIEAELVEDATVFDWFKALFPCGSITGTPKSSTMEYITELENSPRDIYCGAIGYITPDRDAVFNVPIRTVLLDTEENKAVYGVGGGITWNSTVDGEYGEMGTKAQLLAERRPEFRLLETLALENGNYLLLKEHMERLAESANYFGFTIDEKFILSELDHLKETASEGKYKVRLLLSRNGEIEIESVLIKDLEEPIACILAESPIHSDDVFFYHKTTNRGMYEKHEQNMPDGTFSVLLWNERDEITEFTTGNIVVKMNGKYYTPPVSSGLLKGTFRNQLIARGMIEEKIIKTAEIDQFEEVWFINSVRGWLQVDLKK